jgi:hypothetical protein
MDIKNANGKVGEHSSPVSNARQCKDGGSFREKQEKTQKKHRFLSDAF